MNITEFLEARIAEDEAAANAVDLLSSEMETISTHYLPEFADYMLRWQPNSIRAECAAKRAIIAECRADHEDAMTRNDDTTEVASVVLYALAAVYASHPDYQEEWAL